MPESLSADRTAEATLVANPQVVVEPAPTPGPHTLTPAGRVAEAVEVLEEELVEVDDGVSEVDSGSVLVDFSPPWSVSWSGVGLGGGVEAALGLVGAAC